MNLIKNKWNENDFNNFKKYLLTFSKGEEKGKWEQNILNTTLPCIAVPSNVINNIVKQIYKGNYIDFINGFTPVNYSEVAIVGKLICKIPNFNLMVEYLNKYLESAECWATIDLLKFKVTPINAENFFNLAVNYSLSSKPFIRRACVIILFNFINLPNYNNNIYNLLKTFKNETEYYVNMAISWLTCEYFIKNRKFAIEILNSNILNDFTQNKAISKCRDSFRVSVDDKNYLLTFKR